MSGTPTYKKTIILAGRNYTFEGNPEDPYFRNLEGIDADIAPLEAWVRRSLPSDAIVIDAGGNIGVTGLLLSGLLPDGQVHIFEANPTNAAYLRANVAANNLKNCIVNAVALGAKPGCISMQGGGSAAHVTMGTGPGEVADGGSIPMITLDDYARDVGLDRLDFLKIDVEGFEPAVLEGARALIARTRAPILMEFNSWCLQFLQGYDVRNFASALWQAFDVFSVTAAGDEQPAGGGSALQFLHDNVVLHGTVDDVLIKLRPGAVVPDQGTVAPPLRDDEARQELIRLRQELGAVYASKSWKITAPMRVLGKWLQTLSRRR